MKYRAIYRVELGQRNLFVDVEIVVGYLPDMGQVVAVPDGTGRYGRVVSIERVRPADSRAN